MATKGLKGRREALQRAREQWSERRSAGAGAPGDVVAGDIVDSWERSAGAVGVS